MKNRIANILMGGNYQSILEDLGKLVLRVLFGLALAIHHGWPTLNGAFSGGSDFPDPLGLGPGLSMLLAGSAEFAFGLLVVAGLLTRVSLIPILVNFIVAFFIFHAYDPFGHKELAYSYLSAMTAIMLLGPGKYSLDFVLFNKTRT